MAIKVDSEVNDRVSSILSETLETLNSGLKNKLTSDFSPMTQAGLFTTQINNLKKAIDTYASSLESLSNSIKDNKYQWTTVEEANSSDLNSLDEESSSSNSSSSNNSYSSYSSSSSGNSSNYSESNDLAGLDYTVSVSDADVKSFVAKLDDKTIIALLKRIYKLKGNNNMVDLFVDASMSGVLLALLKQILGDTTTDLSTEKTATSEEIQKQILKKLNTQNVDVKTQEGKTAIEKVVLEKIKDTTVDDSVLTKAIYGENTTTVKLLDGSWVVAKTKTDLESYASYIANNGVRQNSDTSKYSDYCLAFSYVHAYDLFTGAKDSAQAAGNYAHAGAFYDFIDDNKQKVLAKVYDEIMKGRPVVIQVNGNKAGTSRHFVTVVGFKEGITSADNLTEKDLLIIDSWDGKIERMDTSTSRFMTTGAACHKEYSGYRLRVLKDTVSA